MGEGRWLSSGPGPPRYHREGERVDSSAAVPGTPAVSQGRAHGAGTGERRQLSGGPGHPSDVTGKGRGETAQRCHWEEERGDGSAAAPGTLAVSQERAHGAGMGGASVAVGGTGGKPQAVWPREPQLRASSGGRAAQMAKGSFLTELLSVRRRRRTWSSVVLSSSRRNEVPGSLFISLFTYLF